MALGAGAHDVLALVARTRLTMTDVALVAAVVAARRATRVDPSTALRREG